MSEKPIPNSYWVPDCHLLAGEYPGAWDEQDAREKLEGIVDSGVTVFMDLTREEAGLDPYTELLEEIAQERGIEVVHCPMPIPDMSVTSADHMAEILDAIDGHLAGGRKVYVHCWGGVGRTGTVVGCYLRRRGLDGDAALAKVSELFGTMSPSKLERHPESSPQTRVQREMVRSWTEESSA